MQWRAKRLRKETGDESIMTEQERLKRPLSEIAHETLLRPLVMLTTEPIMMCMAGYLSLIYGLLYGTFLSCRHRFLSFRRKLTDPLARRTAFFFAYPVRLPSLTLV